MKAAIAQVAHDTLAAVFPSQADHFGAQLAHDLGQIENGPAKTRGIDLGRRAAAGILARRANDGAPHAEPLVGVDFIPGDAPGQWRQDPISQLPPALGARWAEVAPFVLQTADQFRVPPPPALDSPEYAEVFAEVQSLGGDGVTTPTVRTEEETFIGIHRVTDYVVANTFPPLP